MKYPMPSDGAAAKTLVLKDGRKLQYFDNGVSGTEALVLHHGTPGLGSLWQTWLDAAKDLGVRAIAYTKAGYVGSDRAPKRNIADAGADLAELVEAAGLTKFVSIAWSGGGPYALHSTFLGNCAGADLMAGVAPFFEMGAEFLVGQNETETLEGLAKWAESQENAFEVASKEMETVEAEWTPENWQSQFEVRAKYPQFFELYQRFNSFVLPALLNGFVPDVTGLADDNHMILIDWGFRVSQVAKPVSIWNGMLDKPVPPGHAIWQHKQIAGSDLHLLGDQTHASIGVEYMAEILNSAIAKLNF